MIINWSIGAIEPGLVSYQALGGVWNWAAGDGGAVPEPPAEPGGTSGGPIRRGRVFPAPRKQRPPLRTSPTAPVTPEEVEAVVAGPLPGNQRLVQALRTFDPGLPLEAPQNQALLSLDLAVDVPPAPGASVQDAMLAEMLRSMLLQHAVLVRELAAMRQAFEGAESQRAEELQALRETTEQGFDRLLQEQMEASERSLRQRLLLLLAAAAEA